MLDRAIAEHRCQVVVQLVQDVALVVDWSLVLTSVVVVGMSVVLDVVTSMMTPLRMLSDERAVPSSECNVIVGGQKTVKKRWQPALICHSSHSVVITWLPKAFHSHKNVP